jgi:uncharacterized membrane protein HdeD (DUF308 family)
VPDRFRGLTATSTPASSDVRALTASRGWLIIGGILSIIVGFIAMGSPYLFSLLMLGLGAKAQSAS